MTAPVTIVDYGVGNLYSVRRALEFCGCNNIVISALPEDIRASGRLILPGVGAFEDGMRGLRERGLVDPIVQYALTGRPLLGICLGMQMLATVSDEFGAHTGLNLIPGKVLRIPSVATDGTPIKVPSIGWTSIRADNPLTRQGSCLESHPDDGAVYLVHSYHVLPDDPARLLADYDFGGHRITAAIRNGNITGLQFHPEKSGKVGLDVLRKFLDSP